MSDFLGNEAIDKLRRRGYEIQALEPPYVFTRCGAIFALGCTDCPGNPLVGAHLGHIRCNRCHGTNMRATRSSTDPRSPDTGP